MAPNLSGAMANPLRRTRVIGQPVSGCAAAECGSGTGLRRLEPPRDAAPLCVRLLQNHGGPTRRRRGARTRETTPARLVRRLCKRGVREIESPWPHPQFRDPSRFVGKGLNSLVPRGSRTRRPIQRCWHTRLSHVRRRGASDRRSCTARCDRTVRSQSVGCSPSARVWAKRRAIDPSLSSFGLKMVMSMPSAMPEAIAARRIVSSSSHCRPSGIR